MKYHALFVIFEKSAKILNCRLLQNIGGALRVNTSRMRANETPYNARLNVLYGSVLFCLSPAEIVFRWWLEVTSKSSFLVT